MHFVKSIRVIPVSAVLSRVPYECLHLQNWVTPPLFGAAPRSGNEARVGWRAACRRVAVGRTFRWGRQDGGGLVQLCPTYSVGRSLAEGGSSAGRTCRLRRMILLVTVQFCIESCNPLRPLVKVLLIRRCRCFQTTGCPVRCWPCLIVIAI